MYGHILIPTDGSVLSEVAIRQGIALAKAVNARVTGITVFPPFHTFATEPMMITDTPALYRKDCEALGAKYLAVIEDAATTSGVACDVVQAEDDQPYRAIIDTASARGSDLIVMASHGRKGVTALVLGSETTKVLTHTKISVLVCR
ncbi:MAG: universal stress protein [Candidatus Rokubacteria bacterium]|nr:universal stress protein [Candidatus Rokubacteria bacterium]